jgi:hypothetical protein
MPRTPTNNIEEEHSSSCCVKVTAALCGIGLLLAGAITLFSDTPSLDRSHCDTMPNRCDIGVLSDGTPVPDPALCHHMSNGKWAPICGQTVVGRPGCTITVSKRKITPHDCTQTPSYGGRGWQFRDPREVGLLRGPKEDDNIAHIKSR